PSRTWTARIPGQGLPPHGRAATREHVPVQACPPSPMSSIREFFTGRSILLTGGTGFLGKALLEKILRDLPGAPRICLLARPRRRPDGPVLGAAERIRREVFETAIFSRLKQLHGER